MDIYLIVTIASLTVSLFIGLSDEAVSIIEPENGTLVIAPGDEIEVVCEAPERVNVDWKHNGVWVQRLTDYHQRYKWTQADEPDDGIVIHTLTISSTHFGDAGKIVCVNMDNLFTDSSEIRVTVAIDEMFKSQVIVSPSDYEHDLVLGSEFHLSCSGGLETDVRWTQNGEVLEETASRPIVEKMDGTYRLVLLTFLAVNETDDGSYKCIDERRKWRSSEEISIRVGASKSGANIFSGFTIFNISLVFFSILASAAVH